MQEIRPNQLFRIWWLRTWRSALASFLGVAPVAFGFYQLERAGISSPWTKWVYRGVILLIGMAVAWWISHSSLTRRYSDFRLAFIPIGAEGPELPITNRMVAYFWWFLVWRVILGTAAIGFAGEQIGELLPAMSGVMGVITALIILIWEFLVLRRALTRHYPDFRIVVIDESRCKSERADCQ